MTTIAQAAAATLTKTTTFGDLDPGPSQEGTKFEPVSIGYHVGRYVDYIDLGHQEYKGKQTRRLMFLLWVDEKDVDGNPKFVSVYTSTSLFGGGEGASPSNLMKMLRGFSGKPQLTEEDVRGVTPEQLMGCQAGMLIEHKTSVDGKRVRAHVAAWSKPDPKDPKHPAPPSRKLYSRPEWVDKKRVDYVPPEAQNKDMRPLTAEELKAAGALPEPESDNPIVENEGPPQADVAPAGGPSETVEALAQASNEEVPF